MKRLIGSRLGRASLTAALVLALATPAFAAPQRGGGRGTSRSAQSRSAQVPRVHDRGHVAALRADRHPVIRGSRVIVGGGFGFYDPFYRYPYYYGGYPYPYYYGGYPYPYYYGAPYSAYDDTVGDIRTQVTPKDAEIYVDGYYAGTADDFDGIFQRLHTEAGGHSITIQLDGYRTVTQNVYVSPRSTTDVKLSLEKLAPGEVTAPALQ